MTDSIRELMTKVFIGQAGYTRSVNNRYVGTRSQQGLTKKDNCLLMLL